MNGFTLIELLVVIAIIGILSTIAMTSLNSARLKAKDAAIMSAANSIMKAAQIDATTSQDYGAYQFYYWGSARSCDSYFGSTSNPASVKAACNSIINNVGTSTEYRMWASRWTGNYPKLSIMVYLPGAQKFYCVGSNGRSSATLIMNGGGCGGNYNCPGCAGDVTTDGS